jgi:peptide deformylase
MPLPPIRVFGDPVLRTPADPVTVFDDKLARLAETMIETMYAAPGVGLAAPQIGVSLRLFVFDTDWDSADGSQPRHPRTVANPVLEIGSDTQEGGEGCLSVPGLTVPTVRADWARVTGQDLAGEPIEFAGTGLLARCLQHETDHLDGILYLSRLTGEIRKAAQRALRERGLLAG